MIRRSGGIKDIRHIASNVFCAQRWFGCIFTAFWCSLPEPLAQFMQLARSMPTVSIVVPNQEDVLPLAENKVGDIHPGLRSSVGHGVVHRRDVIVGSAASLRLGKTNPRALLLVFFRCQVQSSHLCCQHQLPVSLSIHSYLRSLTLAASYPLRKRRNVLRITSCEAGGW